MKKNDLIKHIIIAGTLVVLTGCGADENEEEGNKNSTVKSTQESAKTFLKELNRKSKLDGGEDFEYTGICDGSICGK